MLKMPDEYWADAKAILERGNVPSEIMQPLESVFYMGICSMMGFTRELISGDLSEEERAAALNRFDRRIDEVKEDFERRRNAHYP